MGFRGLAIGVTGLQSQAKKMEVIGNNLANINTAGFKRSEVNFQETFHDVIKNASSGSGNIGGTNAMTLGSGVTVGSITNIFTQGAQEYTGRNLDFMIEGEDFFVARNAADSSLMLSRNGSFQLDGDGFLVDGYGNKIQGFNVDRLTGAASANAEDILIDAGALPPSATTTVQMRNNIDSAAVEQLALTSTNGWELFSGGENFGNMTAAIPGATGAMTAYGSGFYQDAFDYTDTAATLNGGLTTLTLNASPANFVEGFSVGDTISLLQGSDQVQRTITAINTGTRTLTFAAVPGTFSAGAITVTNMTDAMQTRGTSGATAVHQDILRNQIAMVDEDGDLIATFHRVSGDPAGYTRATATTVGGSSVTLGVAEFTNMEELKEAMELALRDNQLTHYTASNDLQVTLDKFGSVSFSGTGLVQNFRLVMNADNTEMLDRFTGIAVTDAAAGATTQARLDANGRIVNAGTLGLGARTVHASKQWFNATGLQNYGYTGVNPSTEYGEFAGLRMDTGANGQGYGIIQLSLTNALGATSTQQFKMVSKDPVSSNNEFSTMGELAQLLQNTLRTASFSGIAQDGVLVSDETASVSFADGRLQVATTTGQFRNLTVSAVNNSPDANNGITRTDEMNFGTVLGQLADGVNGKLGLSNKFIRADVVSQTQVHDSQGNEHTATSYFVRDRSSGLTNIEWKFQVGLNPNLNTFSTENPEDTQVYSDTFNSIQDSALSNGVLAFDIQTGQVLGANAAGSDARYSETANLSFTAQTNSQEAAQSDITIDFDELTSYNGQTTVIGSDVDGHSMGSLVRIASEDNTGNINGVYSNGKIQTLARIGLMHISNPEGLEKVGSSYYTQTPNSDANGSTKGLDQVYAVGGNANGSSDSVQSKVHGNSLEGSNVDLTEELTDMITTQRSYSASGKIITTTDEMLQEALNLKR